MVGMLQRRWSLNKPGSVEIVPWLQVCGLLLLSFILAVFFLGC